MEVPAGYEEACDRYPEQFIERIAATDDALLERYLGGEELARDEIDRRHEGGRCPAGDIVPAVLRQRRS